LGFSQAATIIALFLSELHHGSIECDHLPQFAILAGGFMPRDVQVADRIIQGQPSMPSLHIYGRNDTFVEGGRTLNLMSQFRDCLTVAYEHEGAHMMPTCSGETKATICSFLDQMHQPIE